MRDFTVLLRRDRADAEALVYDVQTRTACRAAEIASQLLRRADGYVAADVFEAGSLLGTVEAG